jgi:phage-related minor tail protein
MAKEKNVVKGGFRANMALLLSCIALVVAIVAYNRTGAVDDLRAEIADMESTFKKVKKETKESFSKIRQDTSAALENLSKKIGTD